MIKTSRIIISALWLVLPILFLIAATLFLVGYAVSSPARVQAFALKQFGVDLNFKQYHVTWSGLYPTIDIHDLTLAEHGQTPALSVQMVHVAINSLSSLMFFRPVTSSFKVQGLHVTFDRDDHARYYLHNFPAVQAKTPIDYAKLIFLLAPQDHISIHEASITVIRIQDAPLHVQNISLEWNQGAPQDYTVSIESDFPDALAHFEVLGNVTGNLTDVSSIQADFYAGINGENLAKILGHTLERGVLWKTTKGAVKAWVHIQNGEPARVQVLSDLSNFDTVNLHSVEEYRLPVLYFNALWQATSRGGWALSVTPIRISLDSDTKDYFYLARLPGAGANFTTQVGLHQVDVALLSHFLDLWPTAQDVPFLHALMHIDPAGQVSDFYVKGGYVDGRINPEFAHAKINDFHTQVYAAFPAVDEVFGELLVTPNWGEVLLDTPDLKISHNPLFPEDWPNLRVATRVLWNTTQTDPNFNVQISPAQLKSENTSLYVVGNILVPKAHWQDMNFQLVGGIGSRHIERDLVSFLPRSVISPKLYEWLTTGIVSVPNASASVLLAGPIQSMPFKNNQGVFEIQTALEDGILRPESGWPLFTHIAGDLYFHNERFLATTQ
ncbi:MAG: hypothetical protein EBX40_03570, partial [Gammaproteobacteria bacterium]|nr:hypothetical protein [Gammaproteobacteria bacterium]